MLLSAPSGTAADGLESAALAAMPPELMAAAANDEPPTPAQVLVMGEYLVGEADDVRLSGHPDIRY